MVDCALHRHHIKFDLKFTLSSLLFVSLGKMISWIYILILTFSLFLPSFLPLVWLDEEVDDYATIYVTTVSCRAMFITHIYGLSLSLFLSWLSVRNLLYNSIGSLLTWAMNPNLRPLFFIYLILLLGSVIVGHCLFVCLFVDCQVTR